MSRRRPHFEVLENGLSLLLLEAHEAPVAAVQVWAGVGSADERPDEAGLAHFHEHMLFKGTRRRGVGEIAGAIEGEGGRVNAFTSYDVTVYHATLPCEKVGVGVDVLADAVRHSVFDPDEVAREIDVVLEEIRRSEDSPPRVLEQAVTAEAYRVHPYRAPILGTRESVSAITRERLLDFFERWYAPDNLLVVAVGDFEAARVRDHVRAAFEGATPRGVGRHRPEEPPPDGLRSVVLHRDFERASLEIYYPSVSLSHPDAAALDLLAFVLGQGESSRLTRRVKERDELVDAIDSACYTPLDPGLFCISAELDPERMRGAIAAVAREVERLRAAPVSADELEKARANFLAHEHFERESAGGRAALLGNFHWLAGSFEHEDAYLEAVRRATPADLLRVAREYLLPERATVGGLLPAGGPELTHEQIALAIQESVERTRSAMAAPARLPAAPRAPDVRSYRLPCGAALHVARRPEVPVAAARAALCGGLLSEDEEHAGISSFTASMLLRGTATRSAGDFARTVESLAAEIDSFSGRNSFGLTLEATSERFEAGLELLAEALLEPALDPAELEKERSDTLAAIHRRRDRLASCAFDLFNSTHYRTHPYRLPMIGTEKSVAAFTPETVAEHHRRLVRAPNLVIGVAGDVDPDALAQRASALFSDLEDGRFRRPAPAEEPAPTEVRLAELQRAREQVHLVLGFRGLTVADPDRYPLEVLSQVLGGQSGRLFVELRDRQGLAYTVSAADIEGLAPGLFAVYIATAPAKSEAAEAGMLRELERVLQEPPGAEELARAQRYLVGNFIIDEQRRARRAAHLAIDPLYGLGPDEDRLYPDRIHGVTADDVLRVARRVIRLDAYTRVRVGP